MRHRLPWFGLLLAIGACDLKPAPRQQPEPAAAAAPALTPAGADVAPSPAPGAAESADLGPACMQIAVRVANLIVASAPDALLKAQYEQARSDTVRSTAEACVKNKWNADLRRCFLTASTQPELDACKARAPEPAPSRPTRGS